MFPFLLPPARRIVDVAASLAERAQHATEWPITPVDEEFDVQLTGYDSASGLYAYKEQDYDTNAAYYDKAPGRVGTVAGIAGELVTFRPAKTFNGEVISGLPKYARVRRRTKSTGYDAIYEIINPGPGIPPHHIGLSPEYWWTGLGTGSALTIFGTATGTDAELPVSGSSFQFSEIGLYQVYGTLQVDLNPGTLSLVAVPMALDCYFVPQSADLMVYPNYGLPYAGRQTLASVISPWGNHNELSHISPSTMYCQFQTFVEVFRLPAAGHADMKMHVVFQGYSGSTCTINDNFPHQTMAHAILLRTGLYP